jgi:MOSC domain-containing protein YiiM
MDPRVEAVFVAPDGGAPMRSRDSVEAVPGGLRGDRYCTGRGHYAPYDVCEVTLVGAPDLRAIEAETGADLADGSHRRNVVLSIDPTDLLDTTFRVGEATMRATRRRPPCARVEELAGVEGLSRAMSGRAGVCADVLSGGAVAVDDRVEVLEDDPETVGRAIAERLGFRADDGDGA